MNLYRKGMQWTLVGLLAAVGIMGQMGGSCESGGQIGPRSFVGPKAFLDATDRLGAAKNAQGWGGLAVFDYDNDGDLDLFFTHGVGTSNRFLRNDGQANFTDVTDEAGLAFAADHCVAVAVGDLNNDGRLDLLIARQRLDLPSNADTSTILLLNNGPNAQGVVTFRAVSAAETGFASTAPAMSVAVGDLDNDGLLDIVVGRYDATVFLGVLVVPIYASQPNEVWRCTGIVGDVPQYVQVGGAPAGVPQNGASADTAAQTFIPGTFVVYLTDVDADGLMDILYLHDIPGGIDYYHNDGNFNFSLRQSNTLNQHGGWMGIAGGDYNADGQIDYFVTNTGCDFYQIFPAGSIADTQNLPNGTYFHKLLKNNGGVLSDIAATTTVVHSTALPPTNTIGGTGLQATEFGFGATWIDADNRGLLDLYWVGDLVTFLQPGLVVNAHGVGRFLENQGDQSFVDQTAERGIFNIQADRSLAFGNQDAGRAVAAADLDGDGYEDLIVTNATTFGGPSPMHRLFLNPGATGNHWLTIQLRGTTSNRFGIGARVIATYGGRTHAAEVLSSRGAFTGMQPHAHFGLGAATSVDQLEVRWPSGKMSMLTNVAADQVLLVTEPS